jgi:hypothetical protein
MLPKQHRLSRLPNAVLKVDKRKRPVVHVLKFDEATSEFRAKIIVIPDNPKEEAEHQLYCLLINGNGEIVVDSIKKRPIILEAPPLVIGLLEDNPNRPMSRKDIAADTGLSISTIKRAERAGELQGIKVSERRVEFPAHKIEEWVAKRNKAG